jgi:hypothetical protein
MDPWNYSKPPEFTVVFSAQITTDKIKPSKVWNCSYMIGIS